MSFKLTSLAIPGVKLLEPDVYADDRGYFLESFKASDFEGLGLPSTFRQDSISRSKKHVLRGLHYQLPPHSQLKLVTAIAGEVFDVAVDLRRDSPTFGQWVGEMLSESNHHALLIPHGFAHGFAVLSEYAVLHYKISHEYNRDAGRGIAYDDPDIGIEWPTIQHGLSQKDRSNPRLQQVLVSSGSELP